MACWHMRNQYCAIGGGAFWSGMFTRSLGGVAACALLLWANTVLSAAASPWAEVGDNQLRGDIELLQAAGVVRNITIQWPMPWESLWRDLPQGDPTGQPPPGQAAGHRLTGRDVASRHAVLAH